MAEEKKEPKCCCRQHAGMGECPDCPIHGEKF